MLNCHVFVNFAPYATLVPSEMVTSCSSTAASLQFGAAVGIGVVGVESVAATVGVWLANGVRVGGNVAVTKSGVAFPDDGIPIVMHDAVPSASTIRVRIGERMERF